MLSYQKITRTTYVFICGGLSEDFKEPMQPPIQLTAGLDEMILRKLQYLKDGVQEWQQEQM